MAEPITRRAAVSLRWVVWVLPAAVFVLLLGADAMSGRLAGPDGWRLAIDVTLLALVSGIVAFALWMAMHVRHSRRLLEESEQRNRLLLGSLPQRVFFKDTEGAFVSVNERFAAEFGLAPEEIVGKTDSDLFPRELAEKYRADDLRIMESGRTETLIEDHTVAGSHRTVEVAKAPVIDGAGETIGVLGLYVDVTERESERKALHESEERFRELFDNAPVGYHEIDTDGRIVRVNRTELEMLGYEAKEMLGRPVWEFVEQEQETRQAVEAKLREAATAGPPFERTYRCKDGRTIPVLVEDRILQQNEEICGMRSTIQDISDLREAEKALEEQTRRLKESERRFRSFINSTTDFAFIKDQHFRHLFANRAYLEFLGRTQEQVRGKTDFELLPKSLAESCRATDVQVLEKGTVISTEEADGERVFETYKFPVPLGEGEVGVGGLVREITERRKAERALRESQEKFRSIVENIGIGIALIGPDMDILELNRQMREWFPEARVGPGAVCSRNLMGGDSDEPCPDCPAVKTLRDGGVHESVISFQRDGERATYRVVSSPVQGAGNHVQGAIVMAESITETLALEEQLHRAARLQSLGQLAGGVAHDFNNLLTGVIGYAQLLRDRVQEGSDLERDLAEIEQLGERGAALTEQLLSFSRQRLMRPVVLDLDEQVEQILNMLQRLIGEDVELSFHSEGGPARVRGDPAQIQEVLMNLAVNARDAMPAGGRLIIETERMELDEEFADRHLELEEGPYVRLSVTDTGIGMDEKTLEHLFEPFFTTKEPGRGTGLGLATVYGIVSQHGGAISVYSQPGEGTTFKVYLPRLEQEAPEQEPEPADREIPRGTETVLVVEDEDAVRSLARRVLERQGYSVLVASDPAEARGVFSEHSQEIDLLLTDVIMPGENGDQLYESLSARNPSLKVLYMSGYASSTVMQRGVDELDTAFIMKPFDARELCRHVRVVLDAEGEGTD